jgi:hypothetical protein
MKLSESPALCRDADGSRWWLVENTECDWCFGIPIHYDFKNMGITSTHKSRECPECDSLGAHVKIRELSLGRVRVLLRRHRSFLLRQKVSDNG